jgi:hypothetical protein
MASDNLIPIRDQIIDYLKSLPADTSLQEILYHIHIRGQIIEAQQEIKNGNFYTDEQARELLTKWSK